MGAALLTEDGNIVKGCNVENASYGGTICAERTALVKAVVRASVSDDRGIEADHLAQSDGIRKFKAIAVATSEPSSRCLRPSVDHLSRDVDSPVSPCGMCRQFIREFCKLDMPIIMVAASWEPEGADAESKVKIVTLGELLPYSFGPEDLEKPRQPLN